MIIKDKSYSPAMLTLHLAGESIVKPDVHSFSTNWREFIYVHDQYIYIASFDRIAVIPQIGFEILDGVYRIKNSTKTTVELDIVDRENEWEKISKVISPFIQQKAQFTFKGSESSRFIVDTWYSWAYRNRIPYIEWDKIKTILTPGEYLYQARKWNVNVFKEEHCILFRNEEIGITYLVKEYVYNYK